MTCNYKFKHCNFFSFYPIFLALFLMLWLKIILPSVCLLPKESIALLPLVSIPSFYPIWRRWFSPYNKCISLLFSSFIGTRIPCKPSLVLWQRNFIMLPKYVLQAFLIVSSVFTVWLSTAFFILKKNKLLSFWRSIYNSLPSSSPLFPSLMATP